MLITGTLKTIINALLNHLVDARGITPWLRVSIKQLDAHLEESSLGVNSYDVSSASTTVEEFVII